MYTFPNEAFDLWVRYLPLHISILFATWRNNFGVGFLWCQGLNLGPWMASPLIFTLHPVREKTFYRKALVILIGKHLFPLEYSVRSTNRFYTSVQIEYIPFFLDICPSWIGYIHPIRKCFKFLNLYKHWKRIYFVDMLKEHFLYGLNYRSKSLIEIFNFSIISIII